MLSKLAAKYLATPATSAPAERLFSVAGTTFWPERCRLSDANFEKLMNIKCNSNIVFEIDRVQTLYKFHENKIFDILSMFYLCTIVESNV